MKRPQLQQVLLILLCVAGLAACKKDDNGSGESPTKSVLTSGVWKYENSGFDYDKNGTVDAYDPIMEDCEKDDSRIFKPDGSGVYNPNDYKCSSNDIAFNFNWSLQDEDSVLAFSTKVYQILSMEPGKLKLYNDVVANGAFVRYLLILKN